MISTKKKGYKNKVKNKTKNCFLMILVILGQSEAHSGPLKKSNLQNVP